MRQVTVRLPEPLIEEIDRAARQQLRTRTDLVRQAVETYLDDIEDITLGLKAMANPADAVLDWRDVRRVLLGRGR